MARLPSLPGFGLVMLLSLPATVQAQVVYSTGFESPIFTTGQIDGQDGWLGRDSNGAVSSIAANVNIENAFVKSGTQAVEIDSIKGNLQADARRTFNFDTASQANRTLDVKLDAYIDPTGAQSLQWFMSVLSGTANATTDSVQFDILTDANGLNSTVEQHHVFDKSGELFINNPPARGTWNTYDLLLDYKTGYYRALVNGKALFDARQFDTNPSQDTFLRRVQFGNLNEGTDKAYFDNFSVTASAISVVTPEPGPFALLIGIAGTGSLFALRRRLRRKA